MEHKQRQKDYTYVESAKLQLEVMKQRTLHPENQYSNDFKNLAYEKRDWKKWVKVC